MALSSMPAALATELATRAKVAGMQKCATSLAATLASSRQRLIAGGTIGM